MRTGQQVRCTRGFVGRHAQVSGYFTFFRLQLSSPGPGAKQCSESSPWLVAARAGLRDSFCILLEIVFQDELAQVAQSQGTESVSSHFIPSLLQDGGARRRGSGEGTKTHEFVWSVY